MPCDDSQEQHDKGGVRTVMQVAGTHARARRRSIGRDVLLHALPIIFSVGPLIESHS